MTGNEILEIAIQNTKMVGIQPRRTILAEISLRIRQIGIFATAKELGVLVDGSAEEFAMVFMTAYNKEVSRIY